MKLHILFAADACATWLASATPGPRPSTRYREMPWGRIAAEHLPAWAAPSSSPSRSQFSFRRWWHHGRYQPARRRKAAHQTQSRRSHAAGRVRTMPAYFQECVGKSARHDARAGEVAWELSPDRSPGSAFPCPEFLWPSSLPLGTFSPAVRRHAFALPPTAERSNRDGCLVLSWREPLLPYR